MHGTKPSRGRKTDVSIPVTFPVAAVISFGTMSAALAGPTGGVVVSGQASISTPSATATVINQTSSRVQLNWNSFNINANESVQFKQPSATAVALNRILDQNPSQIFGQLSANGRVVLVNPNGILFGPGAQLNVGSLVASSLDVSGYDPVTGRYTFSTTRTDPGAIVNQGNITAADGGSVTLLGGRVANSGRIVADYGTVNLAAGRAATLDLDGDGLLRLSVSSDLLANSAGSADAVANSGAIQANGGQVLLTAQAVQDVYANLVNNTGIVHAGRIDNSGGTIRLVGTGGTVISSGTLDASAADATSTGGSVSVLGDHVGLFDNSVVNVSGATGGGTALIGGDEHGANPDVPDASRTYVSPGSVIDADAGTTGNGGKVVVWSNEVTRYDGSLSARGGKSSGDGGSAEVSGKESLEFDGTADLSAAHGNVGNLLLDPASITIDDSVHPESDPGFTNQTYAFTDDSALAATVHSGTIQNLLTTGGVTLQSGSFIQEGSGTTITSAAGNALTLQAKTDITIDGGISNTGAVSLQAAGNIAMGAGASISGVGVTAAAGTTVGGTAGSGTATFTMQSGSSINAGAGLVSLTAPGDITVAGVTTTGNITATSSSGSILDGGDVALSSSGTVTLTANGSIGASGTPLTVAAPTLAATSGTGVYIAPQGSVTIGSAAGGTGPVDIELASPNTGSLTIGASGITGAGVTLKAIGASNDITLDGTVNAGSQALSLTTDGAIVDNVGAATLAGGSISLSAGGNIGTVTNFTSSSDLGVGSPVVVQTNGALSAIASTPADAINLSLSGTPAIAANAIGVSGAGTIVVQSPAALDTSGWSTGAINAGAGGSVGLRTGGTMTLGPSPNVVGGTPTNLLLSATSYDDGTPGQLSISADNLDLRTSSATTLVATLTGRLDATVSGGPTLTVSSPGAQPLTLGSISDTGGTVNLSASGAIQDDGNPATGVTAGTVTLSGTGVGTLPNPITTTAGNVSATDSGNAGVFLSNSGAFTVTSSSAGPINLQNSGGALTIGALGVDATAGGSVSLVSDGVISGAGKVTGGALTIQGSTLGVNAGSRLATNVTSIDATSTGGLWLTNDGALTVTNALGGTGTADIQTTAGSITVTATSGTGVRLAAGGNGNQIGVAGTVDGGTGDVALTAGNVGNYGAITAGAGNKVKGNNLTVTATSVGTGLSPLRTAVTALLNPSTSAGLFVTNDGALTATNVLGGAGSVDIETVNGALIENAVNANGVTLVAGGAGNGVTLTGPVSGAGGGVSITAGAIASRGAVAGAGLISGNALTLVGSTLGSMGAPLSTAVGSVDATSSAGVFVTNSGPLTVTDAQGGTGLADVETSNGSLTVAAASGTGVTLVAGGAGSSITLDGTVNGGTGTVSVTAGTVPSPGAIVAATASPMSGNALTLRGSTIGSLVSPLITAASSLTAISTGGVFLTDSGAAALTVTDAQGGTGAADIQTTGAALTITAASGNSVTLASGAGDNLTINGTVNAGPGNVSLTAGTAGNRGAVLAGASGLIDGDALTVAGAGIGASAARLNTQVSSLDVTGTNGIFVTQQAGPLSLTNAQGGAGTVDVRTTNSALTVNTTVSGASTTLIAGGAGSALDLTNGSVNVGAGAANLSAGGAITDGTAGPSIIAGNTTLSATALGTALNPLDTQVSSLNANSSGGGIFVSQGTGSLTLTASATGGAVDVQAGAGALTVGGATGTAITLGAGGAGNGITVSGPVAASAGDVALTTGSGGGIAVNSTLGAGSGNVTLTAGTVGNAGSITAGPGNLVTAGVLTLSGSTIGANTSPLNTDAGSLAATSTGGLYVTNAGALTLTAAVGGTGAADVLTNSGSLAVDTTVSGSSAILSAGGAGNGLDLSAGSVNVGTGAATLSAGGAITFGAGSITAGDLTLSAASLGTAASPLATQASTLNAATTAGGIYVAQTNALTITANATGGPVDVQTTGGALTVNGASGTGVTLTGDDIAIDGVINAGAGNVTLTAGTVANPGLITAGAGGSVDANALTAFGSMIGASGAPLRTSVDVLTNVTSTNGLFVQQTGALTVLSAQGGAGPMDISTTSGSLLINNVSGASANLAASGAGATLDIAGSVNVGTGTAALASGGAIIDGTSGSSIVAGNTLLTGASIGSATNPIDTQVANLTATSSAGDIFVSNAAALALSASATGGTLNAQTLNGGLTVSAAAGNAVSLTAGGAGSQLVLTGNVSGRTGNVTLAAGSAGVPGAIVAGTGTVSGNVLNVTGSAVGASGSPLLTNVTSLNASATDGLFITNSGALALTSAAGGAGVTDVRTQNGALTVTAASGNGVTLASGGTGSGITVNGIVNGGAGMVTLTAGSGAITTAGGGQVDGNGLSANGSSIGASATPLNTQVSSLSATATNGGVFVTNAGALTASALATGGAVGVQTSNGALTVTAAKGTQITLQAGGAGSSLTVGGVIDAGAGDVTLTAGSAGAIVAAAGNLVAGNSLTATGSAVGTNTAPLSTAVTSLTATASNGGVFVSEQDGLTLANVSATGDVAVNGGTGDITVDTLKGANIALTAGGTIADGDATALISGSALTLLARSIGAPATLSGTTLVSDQRLSTDVTSLKATSTAGGIYINQLNSLSSVSLSATGGTAGNIELVSASGDLKLQSVGASNDVLLAAGGDIFALPGLGSISAQRAELRSGTQSGAGLGRIGTLAAPLTFSLAQGDSLRLFVPSTISPNDPNQGPSTLTSPGATSTLTLFAAPSQLAATAGFGQFTGFGETQFTSPLEALIKTIQNQTGSQRTVVNIDWGSFDPNVSLFGTLDPAVCLPSDQRDEEKVAKAGC